MDEIQICRHLKVNSFSLQHDWLAYFEIEVFKLGSFLVYNKFSHLLYFKFILISADFDIVMLQVAVNILNSGRFSMGSSGAGILKTSLSKIKLVWYVIHIFQVTELSTTLMI